MRPSARSATRPASGGQAEAVGLHGEALGRAARDRPSPTISSIGVRPGVGDPPAPPGRRRHELGGDHPFDEVVDVGHRAALAAVPDHREAARADHAEERRLAGRLERPVEPRRADDDGVEAPLDRVEHGAARPASSSGRSRSTGGRARRCGTCRPGGGWCRRGCWRRRGPRGARRAPSAAATTLAVPRALISSKSSRPLGVDDARGVDDVDRAGEAGEQRVEPVGSADVAETASTRRRPAKASGPRGRGTRARTSRSGVRAAVADQVVDQRPAQPAAGARHHREVGRVDAIRPRDGSRAGSAGGPDRVRPVGGHRHRLTVSTKRRALRMANAITDACGLTPGASGSSDASLTRTLLGPVHPAEAVGGRASSSSPHRHRRAQVHRHHARPARRRRCACSAARSRRPPHDRRAAERGVDLVGAGLEHQQGQAGQAPAEQRPCRGGSAGRSRADRAGRAAPAPGPGPRS